MKRKLSVLQNLFFRFSRLGLDDSVPDEEARIVMIHNYLILLSSLFFSPFPLIFYFLDLPEGLILCLVSSTSILIQVLLNYFQFFLLSRFAGIGIAILGFILGVLFYGFDAGFMYGIMALLCLTILYFRAALLRVGSILFYTFLSISILYGYRHQIPFYEIPDSLYILHFSLLFFCTLLVISYFLSSDWINKIYRNQNEELVEQLMIRNEELKNFSYSTSHDLKQPLQTILSFVNLFQEKKAHTLDEEGLIYLNFVQKAGTRLNQLIDALLAHSILGQIENFEEIDCNQLVQEVSLDLKAFIQAQEGKLIVQDLPNLVANREELGSVFQNLLTNALKFRKEKTSPVVRVWAEDQGTHWKFGIKDNGKGIETHLKEKIFQMFQVGHTQKDVQGTGIGLANCKKIVNLHGGDIWVESEYGEGSSFFFTVKKMKVAG